MNLLAAYLSTRNTERSPDPYRDSKLYGAAVVIILAVILSLGGVI